MEVIGYPEDHVNTVATKVLEKLKKEQGITALQQSLPKAEKVKNTIFAAMLEVELKVNDYAKLLHFCYDYLPSNLEIVGTEKVTIPVREFSNGLNDMLGKLHQYNLTINSLIQKFEKSESKGITDEDTEVEEPNIEVKD